MDYLKNLETDQYLVPAKKIQSEIKVKGSRFICSVIPCLNREDAEREYTKLKKKYYDATHNCFAWRIDDLSWRFSDDGEPSGTAGKPILQSVDGYQLKEVLCVVTRYFGGTKLGTGGLIRAYGDAASEALAKVKPKIKTVRAEVEITFAYALENLVRKILSEFSGKLTESVYDDSVKMKLALPQSLLKDFCTKLSELSNSQVNIIKSEK
jgi:uncharacterized YigZ family protein